MRILPDDFNVNILLPEAVWLLISVLVGRVSVPRLKTDTITVVLFMVISLVVFIVPMAVYMGYAKRSSNCRSKNQKRASSVRNSSDKAQ